MRQNLFAVFASVFVLVLMLGFASAITLTPSPTSVSLTKQNTTLTVTGSAIFDLNTSNTTSSLTFTDVNSKTAVFDVSANDTTSVSSVLFTISSSSVNSALLIGEYTGTINVTANTTDTIAVPVTFTNTFCDGGEVNASDMDLSVDIRNRGQGDDNDWQPLDDIEIKVKLENNGDTDWDKVVFELGLFKDGSSSNSAGDMIWTSKDDEKVEVGNVNSDKQKTFTFQFRVDPAEVSNDNYIVVVKAYPKGDESTSCIDSSPDLQDSDFGSSTDYLADISISQESDKAKMVVVDTSSYPAAIDAFCDSNVLLTPDVYNIGDDNFNDQIKVTLYNKELGINLEDVIDGDFDSGDKATASFSFDVPKNAAEKTYTLQMETYYDYDSDAETYDESSDAVFNAYLIVAGNCAGGSTASSGTGKAVVSANLQSGGSAGEDLVVKATVTNTGDGSATYIINPASYGDWASSASASPATLTLAKGDSGTVLITLHVKDDASGSKSFNIEVVSGSELVTQQPVSVTLQSKTSLFTGFATGGNNAYLWGLGALNVILIVAIIFVVVRVLRK